MYIKYNLFILITIIITTIIMNDVPPNHIRALPGLDIRVLFYSSIGKPQLRSFNGDLY